MGDRPDHGRSRRAGIRCVDMARSIRSHTQHLASGELGYHVLDILVSIEEAIESRSTEVTSTVEAIPLLSEDWDPFEATL